MKVWLLKHGKVWAGVDSRSGIGWKVISLWSGFLRICHPQWWMAWPWQLYPAWLGSHWKSSEKCFSSHTSIKWRQVDFEQHSLGEFVAGPGFWPCREGPRLSNQSHLAPCNPSEEKKAHNFVYCWKVCISSIRGSRDLAFATGHIRTYPQNQWWKQESNTTRWSVSVAAARFSVPKRLVNPDVPHSSFLPRQK